MTFNDAVRRAARHYPGGVEAVALRLSKSASTLEKELRGAPGFKLGAEDAIEIVRLCQDVGTLHALDYPNAVADAVGGVLFLLPDGEGDSATTLEVAALMRECADVVSASTQADADGVVSERELREVKAQWSQMVSAGQKLMAHMEARHEAGKPVRLRKVVGGGAA